MSFSSVRAPLSASSLDSTKKAATSTDSCFDYRKKGRKTLLACHKSVNIVTHGRKCEGDARSSCPSVSSRQTSTATKKQRSLTGLPTCQQQLLVPQSVPAASGKAEFFHLSEMHQLNMPPKRPTRLSARITTNVLSGQVVSPKASMVRSSNSSSVDVYPHMAEKPVKEKKTSTEFNHVFAQKTGEISDDPDFSSLSDFGSINSRATSSPVPPVSDSYIDRNDYVTKPRWGLSTTDFVSADNLKPCSSDPVHEPPVKLLSASRSTFLDKPGSEHSTTKRSELDDELFIASRSSNSTSPFAKSLGSRMESLSMEKVFNDPSFHGIYQRFNQSKHKGVIQSIPNHAAVHATNIPCVGASEMNPSLKEAYEGSSTEFGFQEENAYIRALKEQIPDPLAILDQRILTLLTNDVVKKFPLLRRLRDVAFGSDAGGNLVCSSLLDLGLEKKNRKLFTDTWPDIVTLTTRARQIYQLLSASGCLESEFVRNIMSYVSRSVDDGLRLACTVIFAATYIAGRGSPSNEFLTDLQRIEELRERLSVNKEFLEDIKNALTENFSAISLVGLGILADAESLPNKPKG